MSTPTLPADWPPTGGTTIATPVLIAVATGITTVVADRGHVDIRALRHLRKDVSSAIKLRRMGKFLLSARS